MTSLLNPQLAQALVPEGIAHWFGHVRIETPWALALLIIPLALLVLRLRKPAAVALPAVATGMRLPRTFRQRLVWLPRVLALIGVMTLIVALARPQVGSGKEITSTDAVAIQLVVDRSGSMAAPMSLDGQEMNRLDVVKRVLRGFLLGDGKQLKGRPADLIGLVQFAGFADTKCPMVRDHRTLQQLADSIPMAQQRFEDGTAIGDGLALAAARLRTAEQDLKARHNNKSDDDFRIKSKVIILLTDGDNNRGEHDPLEAAKLAAEWGIKVYTIGIGSDGYQIMRTPFGDQRMPFRAEVDEKTLTAIADATGGKYWRAQDGAALREIYSAIDQLEKSSVKTLDYVDYQEAFIPWAIAGAALLALQTLLGHTILRRTP